MCVVDHRFNQLQHIICIITSAWFFTPLSETAKIDEDGHRIGFRTDSLTKEIDNIRKYTVFKEKYK